MCFMQLDGSSRGTSSRAVMQSSRSRTRAGMPQRILYVSGHPAAPPDAPPRGVDDVDIAMIARVYEAAAPQTRRLPASRTPRRIMAHRLGDDEDYAYAAHMRGNRCRLRSPSPSASSSLTDDDRHCKRGPKKGTATKWPHDAHPAPQNIHNHWYPNPLAQDRRPGKPRRGSTFSNLSTSTVDSIRRSMNNLKRHVSDVGRRVGRVERKVQSEAQRQNEEDMLRRMAMERQLRPIEDMRDGRGHMPMPMPMTPFNPKDFKMRHGGGAMGSPWDLAAGGMHPGRGRGGWLV